jgi:DNA-binding SARP family transcriptional activator/Tfp pilus assembly protein PilF
MLYLQLLGGLSARLNEESLSGRAAQRKRLALLALLATTLQRSMSRAKLIGLLWPESESERARHQLTTAAYDLRRALGEDVLISTPEELRLSGSGVSCDLWEYEEALRRGDREEAASLYAGAFLDGFFLNDAPEFERWVDAERDRLARSYAQTLERLAEGAERQGNVQDATLWWQHLAAHDPYSSRVALRCMRSLIAAGDPGGALQHARIHASRLRRELEVEPNSELLQLASRLCSERPQEPERTDESEAPRAGNSAPAAVSPAGTAVSGVRDQSKMTSDAHRKIPAPSPTFIRRSRGLLSLVLSGIAVLLLVAGARFGGDRLLSKEASESVASEAVDPRARELYLRGRIAWSERSRQGLEQSVVLFRQAVERDPTFAPAWAGLADAYVILGYLGLGPPAVMFLKGKAAALRALELDSNLAAAYAPLGQALVWERKWTDAERAFQRAIELDPSHATAHQWYGLLMVPLGRPEEAVVLTRRASELDPLSRQISNTYGMMLHYAGHSDEAREHFRQTIHAEPDSAWIRQNPWLLSNASRVYTALGEYAESIRLLELALRVVPSHPRPLADLAYAYAASGDHAKALQVFARADTANPQYAYFRASVFAVLGERDSAFSWLERIEEWGPSPVGELRMDPRMEPIRSDPRYVALLTRLGLSATDHRGRWDGMSLHRPPL